MIQEITDELLKTLVNRSFEFSIAKFGKEPDRVVLEGAGCLALVFLGYERGDEEYEYIDAKDLTSDLDEVAKQRIEKLEQERIKQEQHRKEQEILNNQRQKEERRKKYLELKMEFENEL